jgi:hypothetical protein
MGQLEDEKGGGDTVIKTVVQCQIVITPAKTHAAFRMQPVRSINSFDLAQSQSTSLITIMHLPWIPA